MSVDREQIRRDAEAVSSGPAMTYATHCLALLAELEQAEKDAKEHFQRSMELGNELGKLWPLAQRQAAAEWRSDATEKVPALEARLAKVPALVEAAVRAVAANDAYDDRHEDDATESNPVCSICSEWDSATENLREALAAWESS